MADFSITFRPATAPPGTPGRIRHRARVPDPPCSAPPSPGQSVSASACPCSSFRRSPAEGSSPPNLRPHVGPALARNPVRRRGAQPLSVATCHVGDMTSAFNFSKPDASVPSPPMTDHSYFHRHQQMRSQPRLHALSSARPAHHADPGARNGRATERHVLKSLVNEETPTPHLRAFVLARRWENEQSRQQAEPVETHGSINARAAHNTGACPWPSPDRPGRAR